MVQDSLTSAMTRKGTPAAPVRPFGPWWSRAWAVAAGAVLAAALAPSLEAQYFGQNQVRWDRFDFQVLETEHFRLHHYPEAEEAVRDAARMSERWYERLARALEFELTEPLPLVLYADHPDFQQTNVIDAQIGEPTGGVAEGLRNRIIMPFSDVNADTEHVLGHEIVHGFQFSIMQREGGPGLQGMARVPLWAVEGQAEYLSLGRSDPQTAMWLRDALVHDDFPALADLNRDPQRYFPYRWGHAFWAYVGSEWGDAVTGQLFRAAADEGMGSAIASQLEVDPEELGERWWEATEEAYADVVAGRTHPEELGQPVITPEGDGGRLNLSPSVSPDGSTVAFLSERDLFSIDLFLADVETGEVTETLVSAETDPHLDALAFVHSSGTWSPDGERFAFVVFARGRNELMVVDAGTGRLEEEIVLDGVGALNYPAWSPDGERIAVTGQQGGRSDLWMVEVETGEAERLTDDAYSQVQPAWSPDGTTLAFATDAGPATDLEALDFGPLEIALMDVETGETELVSTFPSGKAVNPVFAPDGESLYFIADPEGVSDVFRVELETGRLHQVTDVATGISGLNPRSEALTVANQDGRLIFTVFSQGNYSLHALSPEEARGRPASRDVAMDRPGSLPPVERAEEGLVAGYLEDPETGLPPRPEYPVEDYTADLALEFVGPLQMGVGTDAFGTMMAGSVSAIFSDMLGDRQLGVSLMAQGEIQDIGGQLFYQNRARRWTYGFAGGRIPTRTAGTFIERDDGDLLVYEVLQRVAVNQALALASYPFSRARRVEFTAGMTRLTFGADVFRFRVRNGQVVEAVEEPSDPFVPESVNLFQGSAALVGDNSVFGLTSPIRGSRWRLEAQPTLGTWDYIIALGDYRRYLSGRPVTLAFRGLHVGRYGPDEDAPDLTPFFVGRETMVRGYAPGSFRAEECTESARGQCAEFERLVGSRMAVANVELRIPLLGVEGFGLLDTPLFPVEVGAFADAGAAWTSEESPELEFERRTAARVPVASAGVTTRIGLARFLALEIYWAYPFQRPERGGHFGFTLAPGW